MGVEARHLVVVPHTHWDREWYRTHEEFRYRLVRLLDELLDLLEREPGFRHFTLDGQTVVLGDYLEVRPQARGRIEALVRSGRLLVGPWFVLPDEWLVSGEALIRNLRLGLRQAEAFGGAMPIGYVPDQFGHVGQLPQIFAGFGFEGAVLWRGVGSDVDRTAFRWEAPDGTGLFTVYLPFGYGNAVHLPSEPDALVERLAFEVRRLEAMSDIPSVLLMAGSDHVRPRPDLPQALARAARKLGERSFEIGTLPGFVRRARDEAPGVGPVHRGELRSGLRSPLLPGCASARLGLKQADFRNDRLLTRYLEPVASWIAALGGDPDPDVIDLAWRVALENHPHDSICGCSVDRVHQQMETRFRRVEEIARSHLAELAAELTASVAVPAEGFGPGAGESLVVWNPHPAGRAQVEAEIELDLRRGRRAPRACHVRDAGGGRIPAVAEPIEDEQVLARFEFPPQVVAWLLPALDGELAGLHVRAVTWTRTGERLRVEARMGSGPGRFDLGALRRELTPVLADPALRRVAFVARRPPRVRLRFVDSLPGYGLRVYRVAGGAAGSAAGSELEGAPTPSGGVAIANAHWRVEAARDGTLCFESRRAALRIEDALRLVSEGDRGDEYNFDPVPEAARVDRPEQVRLRLEGPCQAEVAVVVEGRYRLPRRLDAGRRKRSRATVAVPFRLRVRLARGLDRIDVQLELENRAEDHRLRLHARAPLTARRFEVESAFEVVERPIDPKPTDFGSEHPAERPVGACPQRSFATVDDGRLAVTVTNRGLAEVEAVPEDDGTTSLAITLLRAVGWLSRADLVLRPGDAGPSLPTPGAQVPGPHRAELSWRLHECGSPERTAEAHRFAYPPVSFEGGGPPGAPLGDGATLVSIDDPAVLVSAIEPRADGTVVLRGYNATGESRRVRLAWRGPDRRELEPIDLSERVDPDAAARAREGEATLELRPWQIFALRARRSSTSPAG